MVVVVVRFHCRSSVLPAVVVVDDVDVTVVWSNTSWGTETVIVGDEAELSSSLLLLLVLESGFLEGGTRFLNIVR